LFIFFKKHVKHETKAETETKKEEKYKEGVRKKRE